MTTVRTIGPSVGLTRAEVERISIAGLVIAAVREDRDELARYRALSNATVKATGQQLHSFHSYAMPAEALTRDLTTSSGGALIDLQTVGFTQALSKASILGVLPMSHATSLRGNATLIAENVKGAASWLADDGVSQVQDAAPTFGQVGLSPHTLSGVVTFSHQLVRMAKDAARAFVDKALATTLAEAIDAAILAGSGYSGQPLGIANVAGIDSRAGTSFVWSDALAMLDVCEGFTSADSIAWVAGHTTAKVLRARERATGSGFIAEGNTIADKPMIVSRSAGASTLTVMEWSKCWFADWGALEIAIDPMTNFRDGRVLVRALWSIDVAVEWPGQVANATAVT